MLHGDCIDVMRGMADCSVDAIVCGVGSGGTLTGLSRFFERVQPALEMVLAEITTKFFKTVQNKLHWAVTGKTAAEIIKERVDAAKPTMGLTTWKNAPEGKILKSDVSIAKNYLIEQEIKELERIVTMYLDYAENQAARQIVMRMSDWVTKLDAFLKFNEYDVLTNAGSVSAEVAKLLAEEQYITFRIQQDRRFESDFEKEIKRIEKKSKKPKGGAE